MKLKNFLIFCAILGFSLCAVAADTVKPVRAIAIVVCGHSMGILVVSSDASVELVNADEVEAFVTSKEAQQIPQENRGRLNIIPPGGCPLLT
jgi:malonyl CoA-acyl carrier protein transacylase